MQKTIIIVAVLAIVAELALIVYELYELKEIEAARLASANKSTPPKYPPTPFKVVKRNPVGYKIPNCA